MIFRITGFEFPDPELAEPDGLIGVGGTLHPKQLLNAYCNGIFPWYSEDSPILWFSPDPRCILYPSRVKVSKSMRNILNRKHFRVTADLAFNEVISECKTAKRNHQDGGTWITDDMENAYILLHELGFAHSLEVWEGKELVGGLYGLFIGNIFCGESMFSKRSNASKTAFIHLARFLDAYDVPMIDCQIRNDHLASLGAEEMKRTQFLKHLHESIQTASKIENWAADFKTWSSQF